MVTQPSLTFFAADPSKAFFERFSLIWAPVSLAILLVGVFGTGAYTSCTRDTYLLISVALCLPGVVWPVVFPCAADRHRPFADRFWVKAGVWIVIFSFYGNYFWTHYFYTLLGARYHFDSYQLNDVPVVTYFCTYFYFTFYFALTNVVLRVFRRFLAPLADSASRVKRMLGRVLWGVSVFVLAVGTAVFEAVSIEHFPLYTYTDRATFMTIGSVFYGIYFMFGFPMFFALDESPPLEAKKTGAAKEAEGEAKAASRDSIWYVAQNALAAAALVTLVLDLWRLYIGDIYSFSAASAGIPFVYREAPPAVTYFEAMSGWLSTVQVPLVSTPPPSYAEQGREWVKSLTGGRC